MQEAVACIAAQQMGDASFRDQWKNNFPSYVRLGIIPPLGLLALIWLLVPIGLRVIDWVIRGFWGNKEAS